MARLLCVGLALSVAAGAAPGASGDAGFTIYLPLFTQPGVHIGGYVAQGGLPAVGASIQVRRLTPSGSILVTTKQTDGNGRYDAVVPMLAAGQVYWIQFVGSSPERLLWWSARPYVDPATMGLDVEMPTFDVAGITQVAPSHNQNVSLPYTFQWTARPATPQDSYSVRISGSATFNSGALGYTGSYQLSSLPPGALGGPSYGYYWLVAVSWPDGSNGVQYGDSRVYFNNAGGSSEWVDGLFVAAPR